MPLDEGVALRVEDIGHLHRRPPHGVVVGFRFSRPGQHHGRGDAQLFKRSGRGLQMALRQMQVHGRVREVRVAQQYLNGAQVRARLEQVRGVRMVAPNHFVAQALLECRHRQYLL